MSKPKQKPTKGIAQGAQTVAQVFSLTRDNNLQHPYHLDGDMQMYSQQKIKARQLLRKDQEILKELQQICKLYTWQQKESLGQVIFEKQYKKMQRLIALILRPEIEKEQLDFVVDTDWQHDKITENQESFLTRSKLIEGLWQMIDVWTVGVQKGQYLSFCRLLKKKIARALKTQKETS